MSFTLATTSSSSSSLFSSSTFNPTKPPLPQPSSYLRFATHNHHHRHHAVRVITASSNGISEKQSHPIVQTLGNYTRAAILIGTTVSMIGKLSLFPATARAESPTAITEPITEQTPILESSSSSFSPLSDFLESNSEAIEALKSLLTQKLENGEDEEALNILKRLVSAQPSVPEWKFLTARLLNEMGDTDNARQVFEEILAANPLSFEALFENALLMDRCGEGEAVITRLEEALTIAEEENKPKEARDVRLIMAQILFLQKNVDEALRSYQQLAKEDPSDFRPYFCQGMIYSLLDRNAEAKEQFAKYRELSPKKFEVEGYLRTSLSKMKLFGSEEN